MAKCELSVSERARWTQLESPLSCVEGGKWNVHHMARASKEHIPPQWGDSSPTVRTDLHVVACVYVRKVCMCTHVCMYHGVKMLSHTHTL